MKRMRMVFMVFLVAILVNVSDVFAQQLMSLEEVGKLIDSSHNKEVQAYFKSVERGTTIRKYDIILRGILREPGLNVVMFVTSHRIAAGMSGSPVYINGKLIGAVAYSFNSPPEPSDYSWGGISPISAMMKESKQGSLLSGMVATFHYKGMLFEPIPVGYHQLIPEFEPLAGNKLVITTSQSSRDRSKIKKNPVLKAGMPIVVDLIEWTDEQGETTTISAMGTITYIDANNRVYAFGHPFYGAKNVVYSFRTAELIGTVPDGRPYKLGWKQSDVLGAITFDGAYGIYGTTSVDELKKLHHFDLEFKSDGKTIHNFDIKVADSILTPLLAQAALGRIGSVGGAPVPEEASITQLDVKVQLQGREAIVWKELFASSVTKFGPSTIRTSSYEAAYGTFFSGVYSLLLDNKHGLKISNVLISADFIRGKSQVFKLGDSRFPNKIVWGQDPILEILLVSQDNVVAIAKKASIKVDWTKVEKPVYTKDTIDTEKDSEKVVRGMLGIGSSAWFLNTLTFGEQQRVMPEYFLGPEDFLENLALRLEFTNQKIFVRLALKSRSGLFDETIAKAEDIIPKEASENKEFGWYVIEGGLKDRKTSIKNESMVVFYLDLPSIPSGYVIDQRFNENLFFEVVLDK